MPLKFSLQKFLYTTKLHSLYLFKTYIMKKIIYLTVLVMMTASCGKNSNSKAKLGQASSDSIQQVQNDSLVIVEKKQDSLKQIEILKIAEVKSQKIVDELSKLIGKKMEFYDYVEIVSSIRYGAAEKLGMTNCLNKDCVEYYSKGNFTTVAFMEFNDSGNFVTLKNIAVGKVPELSKTLAPEKIKLNNYQKSVKMYKSYFSKNEVPLITKSDKEVYGKTNFNNIYFTSDGVDYLFVTYFENNKFKSSSFVDVKKDKVTKKFNKK